MKNSRSLFRAALVVALAVLIGAANAHGIIHLSPEAMAGGFMAAPFLIGEVSMVEIKKLLDEQGVAFEQFKQTNDALIKAKAEGKAVGDLELKLARVEMDMKRIDEIKAACDEIQKQIARPLPGSDNDAKDLDVECKSFNNARRAASPTAQVAEISVDDYKAYKSAFVSFMRKADINALSDAERKAMSAGTDSDGGYLMPVATVGRTAKRIYELSPIRQIANVMNISGDALEGLNDIDEASAGWVAEIGSRTDSSTPTLGKYRIEAHEQYAMPKITQKLLDDAAVDVEAWLAAKVADKMARVEASAFVIGNGVGKARGFTDYTTAATGDASRTWGTLEHVTTGTSADFNSTTQANCLFDLIAAFKPGYLQNAKWVTTREVIAKIRKFKTTTTSEYIWQPGLQVGMPDKLLGYPIVNAQDMPALAASSLSMAFGDFMEGYQIVDRLGMRTLRDPFTAKPYVVFYTIKRTGGGVVNFEAIKFIKFI